MKKAAKKKPEKKPAKMGRPTSLNAEVIEKIQQALMACAYIETAAHYAGITRDSFYTWFKRGKIAKHLIYDENTGEYDKMRIPESERIYADFADIVEQSMSGSELRLLKQIDDAARDGNWQAAAWRLERKFPKRWGRAVENPGELNNINIYNTMNIDVSMLSDEKLNERVKLLLIKAGGTYEHENEEAGQQTQKTLLIEQGGAMEKNAAG